MSTTPNQKALVAFSAVGSGSVVLEATQELYDDLKEALIDATDIWGNDNEDGEILIWEGEIVSRYDEWNGDYDVDYEGDFRFPTKDEWQKIALGETILL